MSQNPTRSPKPDGPSWQRLLPIAMLIVVVYLAFALVAFIRADDPLTETLWTRSAWVVQGVEAIAFTAVGWLFGKEVHRGEAEQAKERADEAKGEAKDAKQDAKAAVSRADAAKDDLVETRERAVVAEHAGQRLADAVRAATAETVDGGNERTRSLPEAGAGAGAGLADVRVLADRLFPPQ